MNSCEFQFLYPLECSDISAESTKIDNDNVGSAQVITSNQGQSPNPTPSESHDSTSFAGPGIPTTDRSDDGTNVSPDSTGRTLSSSDADLPKALHCVPLPQRQPNLHKRQHNPRNAKTRAEAAIQNLKSQGLV